MLLGVCTYAAGSEDGAAKKKQIGRIVDATVGADIAQQFSKYAKKQIENNLRASHPELDPKAYRMIAPVVEGVVENRFAAREKMHEYAYPIFERHFTSDELQQIAEFYESSAGAKAYQLMPELLKRSRDAIQGWALTLMPEIHQRLADELKANNIQLGP